MVRRNTYLEDRRFYQKMRLIVHFGFVIQSLHINAQFRGSISIQLLCPSPPEEMGMWESKALLSLPETN